MNATLSATEAETEVLTDPAIDAAIVSAHADWNGITLADFAHHLASRALAITVHDRKIRPSTVLQETVEQVFSLLRGLNVRTVRHYPSSGGIEAPELTSYQRWAISDGISRIRSAMHERGLPLA
jgi:antitoxin component HigA of HigAB toxin-antitoxin module